MTTLAPAPVPPRTPPAHRLRTLSPASDPSRRPQGPQQPSGPARVSRPQSSNVPRHTPCRYATGGRVQIQASDSLGAIAAHLPEAAMVFDRLGLDWAVDGYKSLADACDAADIDLAAAMAQLERLEAPRHSWMNRPLHTIISYLVTQHHAPLEGLFASAISVAASLQHTVPGTGTVLAMLSMLRDDLVTHMAREERLIFPPILRGDQAWVSTALGRMHDDHIRQVQQLQVIIDATRELAPSPGVDELRRLTGSLYSTLREHLHLEDHVLFPRALAELPPIA